MRPNLYSYNKNSLPGTEKYRVSNSNLILVAYSTAFFPRLLTYFGAPKLLNFAHLFIIPLTVIIILLNTKASDRFQINLTKKLLLGLLFFLIAMVASAALNLAGLINIAVQFLLLSEPFWFLVALIATPMTEENFNRIRNWTLGFALFNMLLAIAQYFLIPIGLFPSSGQLLTDNTAGVFVADGGSAGNYISCTVSFYFALYFYRILPAISKRIKIFILCLAVIQIQLSDSKQVFLALAIGWCLLVFSKTKDIRKLLLYTISIIFVVSLFLWAIYYTNIEFLDPYRNWMLRDGLYGPDGEATRTKLAAFRIIPTYFISPLNWIFGLGPGHSVTWFGGWLLPKYSSLLEPLGATIHPASAAVFQVVNDGWIAQESTVYFPLFTWAGIWGDVGIFGIVTYLLLGISLWKYVCYDDVSKFLLLSTAAFGCILTQMEEPGHMLTVAMLLGLSWQEHRISKNTVIQRAYPVR